MSKRIFPALMATLLSACATQPPPHVEAAARPLEVLPGDANITTARQDLLATARDRFGAAAVDRALASPTHLIAKRFAGMSPPPPPGADPNWRPPAPAVLMVQEGSTWFVATGNGWRPANASAAAQIEALLADAQLWREPAFTPACPDYGAQLLLLRAAGRPETVRNSQCTSRASQIVEAALAA